jgi:RHS repeat-associated protein
MFYNADSGLNLTQFRVYDPAAGRWLSRDPIGESSDPAANLYAYVSGNPISTADPSGLIVKPFGPGGPIPTPTPAGGGAGNQNCDNGNTSPTGGIQSAGDIGSDSDVINVNWWDWGDLHVLQMMNERGITPDQVTSALNSPMQVIEQGHGNDIYVGPGGIGVVVDPNGSIVTVLAPGMF